MRAAWLKSMRDTSAPVGTTTVVEAVLMGSVLLAAFCLTVWFFLLAGSPLPDSVAQTTNLPSSCITWPSTSSLPPRRRSQTRSVWTADSLTPPDSG